jgi:hypothetical protein
MKSGRMIVLLLMYWKCTLITVVATCPIYRAAVTEWQLPWAHSFDAAGLERSSKKQY